MVVAAILLRYALVHILTLTAKMENETKKTKEKTNKNIESLIEMEWEIITELHAKLKNPDLTTIEYTKAASALGFHISTLNKMLNKNREDNVSDEQNLGEYVKGVTPKTSKRWDFRVWKRRLSLRRY
jgi:hypothetical protein